MIAERHYFLTSDGKVTTKVSEAAVLLVAKGCEVPPHIRLKYSLTPARPAPGPSETQAAKPEVELKIEATAEDAADVPVAPKKKAPARRKK